MRLLLAEDEPSLSRALVRILEKSNYAVEAVYNGQDALTYLETGNYDAAILDIMMPGLDGITVLKKLRSQQNSIPILLLTAKSEIDDKVLGLDSGANDYLTKPFDTRELLARLRVMTRSPYTVDSQLILGNISLDRATFMLASPYDSLQLSNKEFQIMELLMANPGNIVSTRRLMEKIWGYNSNTEINVVWVYISYLRKKLKNLQADIQIRATRNIGYSLEEINGQ